MHVVQGGEDGGARVPRSNKPRPPTCGLDLTSGKPVKAKPGHLKKIKLYIKLNTPGTFLMHACMHAQVQLARATQLQIASEVQIGLQLR